MRALLLVCAAATSALRLPAAGVAVPCRGTAGRCGATRAVQARVAAPPPPPGVERQKKRHALLFFGFSGTGFYGLQGQSPGQEDPDKPAVSDRIRTALLEAGFIQPTNWAPLARTKWTLASRTDKGVHAVCAAASVMIETLADDVEADDRLTDGGGGGVVVGGGGGGGWERGGGGGGGGGGGMGGGGGGGGGGAGGGGVGAVHWQLSPAALARVNARLPQEVRPKPKPNPKPKPKPKPKPNWP